MLVQPVHRLPRGVAGCTILHEEPAKLPMHAIHLIHNARLQEVLDVRLRVHRVSTDYHT